MAGTDTGMKWLKRQIDKLPQGSRYSGEGVLTPTSAEQAGGASWSSKIEDNMRETPKDKADSLKETLNRAEVDQEIKDARAQGKKKGGKITHYKSASAAVKEAEKRGDKSITVKFNHRDGIAQRGHTKGRMR